MRSAPSNSPSHILDEATPFHRIKGQTSHIWCHHTHVSRKEINTTSPQCNICNRKADNLCLSLCLLPVDHQRQSRSQLLCSSQRDGSLMLYLIHRLDMMLRCPWLTPKSGNNRPAMSGKTVAFLCLAYCIDVYSPAKSAPCSFSLCFLKLKASQAHFPDVSLHQSILRSIKTGQVFRPNLTYVPSPPLLPLSVPFIPLPGQNASVLDTFQCVSWA